MPAVCLIVLPHLVSVLNVVQLLNPLGIEELEIIQLRHLRKPRSLLSLFLLRRLDAGLDEVSFVVVDARFTLPGLLHPIGRHGLLEMAEVLFGSAVVIFIFEFVDNSTIHGELLCAGSKFRHLLVESSLQRGRTSQEQTCHLRQ